MTIENKGKNKKIVIKKRFFVICILIAVVVVFLLVMGIKSVIGIISEDQNAKETSTKVEADVSSADSDSGNTGNSQGDAEEKSTSNSEIAFSGTPDENSTEYKINRAVLSSWFISPLGQKRSTVDETFGSIVRSEEWGKRIYYHRSFVDTMYVTYKGDLDDDNIPVKDAVCDSVSIALNNVLEFDKFTPNKSFWGEIHDEKGNYAEDQYYLVSIRNDIEMKVYCDQQGRVSDESHIVVSEY